MAMVTPTHNQPYVPSACTRACGTRYSQDIVFVRSPLIRPIPPPSSTLVLLRWLPWCRDPISQRYHEKSIATRAIRSTNTSISEDWEGGENTGKPGREWNRGGRGGWAWWWWGRVDQEAPVLPHTKLSGQAWRLGLFSSQLDPIWNQLTTRNYWRKIKSISWLIASYQPPRHQLRRSRQFRSWMILLTPLVLPISFKSLTIHPLLELSLMTLNEVLLALPAFSQVWSAETRGNELLLKDLPHGRFSVIDPRECELDLQQGKSVTYVAACLCAARYLSCGPSGCGAAARRPQRIGIKLSFLSKSVSKHCHHPAIRVSNPTGPTSSLCLRCCRRDYRKVVAWTWFLTWWRFPQHESYSSPMPH